MEAVFFITFLDISSSCFVLARGIYKWPVIDFDTNLEDCQEQSFYSKEAKKKLKVGAQQACDRLKLFYMQRITCGGKII